MGRPGLSRNKKWAKFARLIGDECRARGALEFVWEFAYEAGDPVLGGPAEVESIARWRGKKGALFAALRDCGVADGQVGFIEPAPGQPDVWQVHDLYDHAPEYVVSRRSAEEERRKEKRCHTCGSIYHSSDKRSKHCSAKCRTQAWRDGKVTDGDAGIRHGDAAVTDGDGPRSPAPAPAPAPAPDQEDLIPETEQNVLSPAAQLQKLWNELMPHPPFPRWVAISEDRKKAAKARWEEHPSEGYWREVLVRISRSPWCRGEVAGRDQKTWIADPDFLLRPGTHGKAMEGKYDRRDPTPAPRTSAPAGFRLVKPGEDIHREGSGK